MTSSFPHEFPYELRDDARRRAIIGLLVLQTDETLECDTRHDLPAEIADVYVSRVPNAADVTPDTLADMAAVIDASAQLLPRSIAFDVVGYCCTSGTAVIGAAQIAALVRSGCRTNHVTDPVSALIHVCRDHDIRRLALLSPYIESVSARLRETLAEAGIETPVFGSFNEADDAKVARIDPQSTKTAAIELARSAPVDAVFMSCTNLRTRAILDQVKEATGIPAFSSNSVLAAHLGHLAGVPTH